MARRPGLKDVPLDAVEKMLRRQRADRRDVYAPLSDTRLEVRNSLGPLEGRYWVIVKDGQAERRLRFSPTALGQFCGLLGVPGAFLERVPASLGLATLGCLREMSAEAMDRQYLFRMREGASPTLRAILPQSYVRLDDEEVLAEVQHSAARMGLKATTVTITDDMLHLRVALPGSLNLGTLQRGDPAYTGIDVLSSETGRHRLQVRKMLFRVACGNALTHQFRDAHSMRARYTRLERPLLRRMLQNALDHAVREGPVDAARLASMRSDYVAEPMQEIEGIFRHYRLGSTQGRIGRWVIDEVVKNLSLFGVDRFTIVQAFTAVARGLEPSHRMRFEDAMGHYLLHGRN